MNLPPLNFTVLDTETTGFVPKVHRIIEFASVRYENGVKVDEYETLISIPGDVPPPVEVLTRIRTGDLEGKPEMDDVRDEILSHIGEDTIIVGQNVGFDVRMLKGEEIDLTDRPWFDTSMLASVVFPEFASYSLGYMSKVLNLHHEPVHRALGDVNATSELLSKIWERLLELSEEEVSQLHSNMEKSTPAYKALFGALPEPTASSRPTWLTYTSGPETIVNEMIDLSDDILTSTAISPKLIEESLDIHALQTLIEKAKITEGSQIIAVKNLDTALAQLSNLDDVRVLFPPWKLLDPDARDKLLAQNTFTADEATLATKLHWYRPESYNDLPIHGDERSLWNGKITCTESSPIYRTQFESLPSVALIDHQQLLTLIASEDNPIPTHAHIIITDASMLEDTSTAAYDWYCSLDDLRAGATGNESLSRVVDLLQIWIEKTRGNLDQCAITPANVSTPDANGLKERIDIVLEEGLDNDRLRDQITALQKILNPENLGGRISWIEVRKNDLQVLRSAPENVGAHLEKNLYTKYETTLLVPSISSDTLGEILPKRELEFSSIDQLSLPLTIDTDMKLEDFFKSPPPGKTVLLVSSRKTIEDIFIKYTEDLEEKGVTLICQNWGGGMSRMQAEFSAVDAPAIWVLTPWSYEGAYLPMHTLDHIYLHTLPFDFPSHPIFSKRSLHYKNGFEDYSLPRLEHRLFRLLRTFCRHKKGTADVHVIDNRIKTKNYGQRIVSYFEQFMTEENDETQAQQSLF